MGQKMNYEDGLELPKQVDLLKKREREREKLEKSPRITGTVREKEVYKLSTRDHSGNPEDT